MYPAVRFFCYFMEFSELKIPYDTVRDDLHESEMMIQS